MTRKKRKTMSDYRTRIAAFETYEMRRRKFCHFSDLTMAQSWPHVQFIIRNKLSRKVALQGNVKISYYHGK